MVIIAVFHPPSKLRMRGNTTFISTSDLLNWRHSCHWRMTPSRLPQETERVAYHVINM